MQIEYKKIPLFNAPITFNNKVINGFWTVSSEPPGSITAGWTTITTGMSRPTFDPANGVGKTINMTTTQIDGDYVSSYNANDAFQNDQLPFYAPSAGVWNNIWDNCDEYSAYTDMKQNFGEENVSNTIGIVTIDFFHRTALRAENNIISYDTCPDCQGEGGTYPPCSRCNGTGIDPDGYRTETCWDCGGAGTVDYGEGPETCHECHGTGWLTVNYCVECNGGGTVWSSCDTCDGDGQINEVWGVQASCPFDGGLQYSIQTIPSSTTAFFNYENLQSIDNLFKDCGAITGNIIPFITAFSSICPNVSHTGCFYGCTGAADYAQATSLYPDWF